MTDLEIAETMAKAHIVVRMSPLYMHEKPVTVGEAFQVIFSKSPGAVELMRVFCELVFQEGRAAAQAGES